MVLQRTNGELTFHEERIESKKLQKSLRLVVIARKGIDYGFVRES